MREIRKLSSTSSLYAIRIEDKWIMSTGIRFAEIFSRMWNVGYNGYGCLIEGPKSRITDVPKVILPENSQRKPDSLPKVPTVGDGAQFGLLKGPSMG